MVAWRPTYPRKYTKYTQENNQGQKQAGLRIQIRIWEKVGSGSESIWKDQLDSKSLSCITFIAILLTKVKYYNCILRQKGESQIRVGPVPVHFDSRIRIWNPANKRERTSNSFYNVCSARDYKSKNSAMNLI